MLYCPLQQLLTSIIYLKLSLRRFQSASIEEPATNYTAAFSPRRQFTISDRQKDAQEGLENPMKISLGDFKIIMELIRDFKIIME